MFTIKLLTFTKESFEKRFEMSLSPDPKFLFSFILMIQLKLFITNKKKQFNTAICKFYDSKQTLVQFCETFHCPSYGHKFSLSVYKI